MCRMRRTRALEVRIRGQAQVFNFEWALQNGMHRLFRKTETNREGPAQEESLEVHMPRPGMGAPTLDVKCEMPSVPNVHGGKTMAREELKGAGGGLEIRSSHAPQTIKIISAAGLSRSAGGRDNGCFESDNYRAVPRTTIGLCPGAACR